jgi:LuxR family maltose regulon positive regulatory protein
MPKIATSRVAWLPSGQTYAVEESGAQGPRDIQPDSPAWFAWLDTAFTFAFRGQNGHLTARKEMRPSGVSYWYAYRGMGKKLSKRYLGKTNDVTLARLEHVATDLAAALHVSAPSPPGQAVSLDPEPGGIFRPYPVNPEGGTAVEPTSHPGTSPGQRDLILATKLQMPRLRTRLVSRAHLIQLLDQGLDGTLTLISAPAGFGKTTLLTQWLAESELPVAWLSLESADNDPFRFLSYFIAAMQTRDPSIGKTTQEMLLTPQLPQLERALALLANDLARSASGDFVLVLDDYHAISTASIHSSVTYLLEHLPPQFHLVIVTRADPPFPLARLRARGQLTELRAADLRFSSEEASAFLNGVMKLALPPADVAALEQHNEGWIAGLQFAGLSLQGRADTAAFVAGFTGSHRFVLDYLSDEVFAKQTPQMQSFLLHTCVLDNLSGPLCNALTEQRDSQFMLERLESDNVFVVSLDDERHWYRYHHLFADVLRTRLRQTHPEIVPILHGRASRWYEQHDLVIEAVHHALAACDFARVADLIEQRGYTFTLQGHMRTMLEWLKQIPETLLLTRPRVCTVFAMALLLDNRLEASAARLLDAEQFIQRNPSSEDALSAQGQVYVTRGFSVLYAGKIEDCIELCRQALDHLPEGERGWRASAMFGVARTYLVSGQASQAVEEQISAVVAHARSVGNLATFLGSVHLLAQLQVLQGRLRTASGTYEQAMQLAPGHEGLQTVVNGAAYFFGLGDLLREWNDLDAAERHLAQGMELVQGTVTVWAEVLTLGYLTLAQVERARGNYQAARAALDTYVGLARARQFVPHWIAQASALRAQFDLAQGDVAAAARWAEESGISADDADLRYARQREYLALARVRIAQGRANRAGPFLDEALRLVAWLAHSAEEQARMGNVIEILILHALALQAQSHQEQALIILERALVLAEPAGYVRLFADEGAPMADLLEALHVNRRGPQTYIERLRSVCDALPHVYTARVSPVPAQSGGMPSPRDDVLSGRENEVLELMAAGVTNGQIAQRLVIEVSTVKRHVSNILAKLNASNRTQAVARARALGIL